MRIFIVLILLLTVFPLFWKRDIRTGRPQWFNDYEKRFAIEMNNSGNIHLKDHPIILQVKEIQKKFGDFNPSNFVLIEALPNEENKIVSSQIDDTDEDGVPDELVFVYTLQPSSKSTLFCYYSQGKLVNIDYLRKADANMDWTTYARMVGWESNWCGYSFYDGKNGFLCQTDGRTSNEAVRERNKLP